jgi:hypothetical protein
MARRRTMERSGGLLILLRSLFCVPLACFCSCDRERFVLIPFFLDLQNREDALDDERIHSGGPSSPTPTTHSSHSGNGVKRSRTLPVSRRSDSDSKRQATTTSAQTAAGELVQASGGSMLPKDKENYGSSSLGSGAKDPSRRGLLLKKGRRASHAVVEKDRTL